MRLSKAEAESVLAPFLPRFSEAIAAADADLRNDAIVAPELRNRLRPPVLAQLRQENVLAHTKERINRLTDPDVGWIFHGQVHWMIIRDRAAVRFKQLDHKMIPRNYPTASALELEDPALPLEGMPESLAKLIVGWQADPFERAVQKRLIVQPNLRKRPPWYIDLDEIAAQSVMRMLAATQVSRSRQVEVSGEARMERGLGIDEQRDAE